MSQSSNSASQYPNIREMWDPHAVAKHYGLPVQDLTGQGQKVGIMSLGAPPEASVLKEVIHRASNHKFKGTFQVLTLPGDPSQTPQNYTQTGEYALDVQIVGTLCPQADITLIVGAPTLQGMADVINKAVELGCGVLTSSVGFPETVAAIPPEAKAVAAVQAALQSAVKHNMTVCSAAGDAGSGTREINHAIAAADGLAHLGFLSAQQDVVACGGTEIRNDNGSPVETTWNNSNLHLNDPYGAAGAGTGGVAKTVALPTWQSAFSHIINANTHQKGRIVPDVAGVASFSDWDVVNGRAAGPDWQYSKGPSGGTSAVAPFYAAIFTLINEQRATQGKGTLGCINEWLYGQAQAQNMFNAVTQGDNRPKANYDPSTKTFSLRGPKDPYPGYDAGPGYDACTGWGTPNGANFFNALVNKD